MVGKTIFACMCGWTLFCIITIFLSSYWWIGVMAGALGSYIAYAPKQILEGLKKIFSWVHPIVLVSTILTSPLAIWLVRKQAGMERDINLILIAMFSVCGYVIVLGIIDAILREFADHGASLEMAFYVDAAGSYEYQHHRDERIAKYTRKGYTETPLTYTNAQRWIRKGMWIFITWLTWRVWKKPLHFVWSIVKEFFAECWNIITYIHTQKPLVCAIDMALMGIGGYFLFYAPTALLGKDFKSLLVYGLAGTTITVLHVWMWDFFEGG